MFRNVSSTGLSGFRTPPNSRTVRLERTFDIFKIFKTGITPTRASIRCLFLPRTVIPSITDLMVPWILIVFHLDQRVNVVGQIEKMTSPENLQTTFTFLTLGNLNLKHHILRN